MSTYQLTESAMVCVCVCACVCECSCVSEDIPVNRVGDGLALHQPRKEAAAECVSGSVGVHHLCVCVCECVCVSVCVCVCLYYVCMGVRVCVRLCMH